MASRPRRQLPRCCARCLRGGPRGSTLRPCGDEPGPHRLAISHRHRGGRGGRSRAAFGSTATSTGAGGSSSGIGSSIGNAAMPASNACWAAVRSPTRMSAADVRKHERAGRSTASAAPSKRRHRSSSRAASVGLDPPGPTRIGPGRPRDTWPEARWDAAARGRPGLPVGSCGSSPCAARAYGSSGTQVRV